MMAGLTIGVSHLVQSTRAGAGFGFQLVVLVIAVNIAKYPFFEYGHRYAAATGESLLHGYHRLGRWVLFTYLLIYPVIAVIGIAAIVFVTVALAQQLFPIGMSTTATSALLIAICASLIIVGRFRGLDLAIKVMIAALVTFTLLALAAAVLRGPVAPVDFEGPSPWRAVHLGFLIALMGWMPGGMEVPVFQSLWVVARDAASGRRMSVSDARLDFNIGYWLSTFLALVFLSLGALVMYGSGETLAGSSVEFASNFVGLYGRTLGEWMGPIMAIVALVAMLSTALAAIDAAPRSLAVAQRLLQRRENSDIKRLHTAWMIGVCLTVLVVVSAFRARFTLLIDLATMVAFLAAPAFAFLNMRLIASERMPNDARPGAAIRVLAVFGLLFLVGFGVLYLVVRMGGLAGP
jgi:Mn2+/Fe2+ NRAMP family transporter